MASRIYRHTTRRGHYQRCEATATMPYAFVRVKSSDPIRTTSGLFPSSAPAPSSAKVTALWGPFTIAVEHLFNNVEVSLHEFDYLFVFPKPKPRRYWPFRNIYVVAVADKNVKIDTETGWTETRCRLKFTLKYKDKVRLFLATRYEFSSAIALCLTVLLTVICTEAGPAVVAWIFGR